MKGRTQNLMMLLAIAALVYVLFTMKNKSNYSIDELEYAPFGLDVAAAGPAAAPVSKGSCGMRAGTGLASSLLPRFYSLSQLLQHSPGNGAVRDCFQEHFSFC